MLLKYTNKLKFMGQRKYSYISGGKVKDSIFVTILGQIVCLYVPLEYAPPLLESLNSHLSISTIQSRDVVVAICDHNAQRHHPQYFLLLSLNICPRPPWKWQLILHLQPPLTVFCLKQRTRRPIIRLERHCRSVPWTSRIRQKIGQKLQHLPIPRELLSLTPSPCHWIFRKSCKMNPTSFASNWQ